MLCCHPATPAAEATKCHIRCGSVKGPPEVSSLHYRPVNVPTGGSSLHGGRVRFNDPRGVKTAHEAWFQKAHNQLEFIFWLFGRQKKWTCSHLFNSWDESAPRVWWHPHAKKQKKRKNKSKPKPKLNRILKKANLTFVYCYVSNKML